MKDLQSRVGDSEEQMSFRRAGVQIHLVRVGGECCPSCQGGSRADTVPLRSNKYTHGRRNKPVPK